MAKRKSRYLTTHGIVLSKHVHRDEKSIVSVVLTSDIGKINVIVRGVRKDTHKWGASFEPLESGEMVLYPIGDRYVLTSFNVDTIPPKFIRDNPRLRMAIALLVDTSIPYDSDAYAEWDVLVNFLHSHLTGRTSIAKLFIEYIAVLGYRVFMSGNTCGVCGRKYDGKGKWYYTPHEGYFVCESCNVVHSTKLDTYEISAQTVRQLGRLKSISWHDRGDFISNETYHLVLDRMFALIPVSDFVKQIFYFYKYKG